MEAPRIIKKRRIATTVVGKPMTLQEASHPASSVHSLANELLSKIFLFATYDSYDPHDTILYPIIVSHVSSLWRQVALSTSALWTSIILTHPSPWSQLSRTVAYLSRSRRRPLRLFLDFRDPSWNWEEESHSFGWKHMENVVRLLSPHVSRWLTLELLTDTWAPIYTFLWYVRNVESAPMLENISLSRCNIYFASKGEIFRPTALKRSIPLFGSSKALGSLRKVVLAGVHVDWTKSGLSNLVELELKYHALNVMPTLGQFVDILTACPDLQRLTILGWGPQFDATADHISNGETPLHTGTLQRLARLQYLTVGFLDVEYTVKLLGLFCLPALESLTLEDLSATIHPTTRLDASPLLEFLTATQIDQRPADSYSVSSDSVHCFPCLNIHSLELRAIIASEHIISQFLHHFTHLRYISITDMDNTIFAVLGRPVEQNDLTPSSPASEHICSSLQRLVCKKVDSEALLNLVHARASGSRSSSLSNVTLDIRGEGNCITPDRRHELVGAGIGLIIEDNPPRRPSLIPLDRPGMPLHPEKNREA